jgi:hypothetical protein
MVAAEQWSFDAYALEEASEGRPLSTLAFWLLHTSGFVRSAQLDQVKLAR